MSMNRHEPFEELISASLRHGDLTPEERDRLDRHLDDCAECRATLAAFADQRRIVAGLRHVPPPRDLHARIRAGLERRPIPWWRRPQVAFAGIGGSLALVAGALLAFVVLNGQPNGPTGQASPIASDAIPSASVLPSSAPSVAPSAEPSVAPLPTEPAETPAPEPKVFVAVTGPVDNQLMTIRDGATGDTITEVAEPVSGAPIAAELSPDGQWLAYITTVGETGLHEVRATRIAEAAPSDDPDAEPPIDSPVAVGETVLLGDSVGGGPFLEHLFWSPDARYLAFTLIDPDGGGADVWLFEPGTGDSVQVTDSGRAYAGSWAGSGGSGALLWVSTAGQTPRSDLVPFHHSAGPTQLVDPTTLGFAHAENVFQPIISPDGALAIFWSGAMDRPGEEWIFVEGGAPWLAENTADGAGGFQFTDARELFGDVTIGRDAFESAAITWGGDSDAYAVWDAAWEGRPQGSDEAPYPDRDRVYFGHATDPRGLTVTHAIDREDVPDGTFVVDVKVSATGRHLVITARYPSAGILDPLRAHLLLVERNTGSVADDVTTLGDGEEGWFGPAAFRIGD